MFNKRALAMSMLFNPVSFHNPYSPSPDFLQGAQGLLRNMAMAKLIDRLLGTKKQQYQPSPELREGFSLSPYDPYQGFTLSPYQPQQGFTLSPYARNMMPFY